MTFEITLGRPEIASRRDALGSVLRFSSFPLRLVLLILCVGFLIASTPALIAAGISGLPPDPLGLHEAARRIDAGPPAAAQDPADFMI